MRKILKILWVMLMIIICVILIKSLFNSDNGCLSQDQQKTISQEWITYMDPDNEPHLISFNSACDSFINNSCFPYKLDVYIGPLPVIKCENIDSIFNLKDNDTLVSLDKFHIEFTDTMIQSYKGVPYCNHRYNRNQHYYFYIMHPDSIHDIFQFFLKKYSILNIHSDIKKDISWSHYKKISQYYYEHYYQEIIETNPPDTLRMLPDSTFIIIKGKK